jgi:formiminotetrahydrofolate cyclodeaminase
VSVENREKSMTSVDSRTIAAYAAEVASSAPTPGGGSVAATTGALAAALAEMVANVTLSGKVAPAEPDALRTISTAGSALRTRLLELALADEQVYGRYRNAAALPRATDEEKQLRRTALDAALIESANVPIEIARAGVAVLELLRTAATRATTHILSDVSTGAVLAEASILGALFTASINADLMRDPDQQSTYRAEIAALEARASSGAAAVLAVVRSRS